MKPNSYPGSSNRSSKWSGSLRGLTRIALLATALFVGVGASCVNPETRSADAQSEAAPDALTLTVGLYPYVPNLQEFQTEITNAWAALGNGVGLSFVPYDCYSSDPPPSLDVFVFDGVFLSNFADAPNSYLRPFGTNEIKNQADYLAYAINGCFENGSYYALPQIGCTNILYYRSGDAKLAAVQTLDDLWNALGPATYTWPKPPQGVGFMMDFSGGTTDACVYIAAWESYYNTYTTTPPTPSASNLDPNVLKEIGKMVQMAGPAQAAYSDTVPYQRAQWFDGGTAEAMVGFTESMSQMPSNLPNVEFKEMPMGGSPNFSLFYVDVVGVNASVTGTSEEPYAVPLANLMSSTSVIVNTFGAKGPNGLPQYLMPVRTSVFQQLGAQYPVYQKMYKLILSLNPKFFRLGPASRAWLNGNKDGIRQVILSMGGLGAPELSETKAWKD